MSRVIVVGNVKGGVGKSTTAVQLALHAVRRGMRVLLVDADPGRSALSWATRAGDEWPLELAVVAHPFADLPRRLPALAEGFQLVIVDTPHSPTEGAEVGPLLAGAIAVADEILVPTQPLPADLDRLGDMLATLETETMRRDLTWRLVFTRVDLRWGHVVETRSALVARGIPVVVPIVPLRTAVAKSFGTAQVRREYAAVADDVLTWARQEVGT